MGDGYVYIVIDRDQRVERPRYYTYGVIPALLSMIGTITIAITSRRVRLGIGVGTPRIVSYSVD